MTPVYIIYFSIHRFYSLVVFVVFLLHITYLILPYIRYSFNCKEGEVNVQFMDKVCGTNSGAISHSLAGALCIFASREEGVIEYFKNLDGFRLEDDGTIRAIQFAGDRWVPLVLEGYKLIAMRSIRDHAHLMSSYVIDFYFNPQISLLTGIKIQHETSHEAVIATNYIFGDCSSGGVHKKIHYNAGLKTLRDIITICRMEVKTLRDSGISINPVLRNTDVKALLKALDTCAA